MATFSELGISASLIKALKENNIHHPTDIQAKAIPFLLENGTDLIAQAQTGTGKTAAFGLPLLQNADPDNPKVQAIVLTPTRELGQQIAKQLFRFTKYGPKIFTEAVYGGAPIENQIRALSRPTQIVVATPGRLLDLVERKALDLSQVKTVVLDEADEMLSMGFKKELDQILERTAGQRYTWLFSATMPPEIRNIISNYMSREAYRIQPADRQVVNQNIDHFYTICEEKNKPEVLLQFLKDREEERGVIFCRTKAAAETLTKQLQAKNIPVGAIQGNLLQKERDKVMRAFKNHSLRILVATDIAARGIDIDNLAFVVHYQIPEQIDYYTHRSGRTARAGKKGISQLLITSKEVKQLQNIEKSLDIKIKQNNW